MNTDGDFLVSLFLIILSYLISKRKMIRQAYFRSIQLTNADTFIYENESTENKTITIINSDMIATVVIRYGNESNYIYSNISPKGHLHIELKPNEFVSGLAYLETADINLVIYE